MVDKGNYSTTAVCKPDYFGDYYNYGHSASQLQCHIIIIQCQHAFYINVLCLDKVLAQVITYAMVVETFIPE